MDNYYRRIDCYKSTRQTRHMCIRLLDSAFSTNKCPAMPQHKPHHKPSTLPYVTLHYDDTVIHRVAQNKILPQFENWFYVGAYTILQLKGIWTKFGTEVCKGLPKHLCKYQNIIHCDCQVITNYHRGHFILSHPVIIVCQLTARFVFTVPNFYSFLPLILPDLFQNGR